MSEHVKELEKERNRGRRKKRNKIIIEREEMRGKTAVFGLALKASHKN